MISLTDVRIDTITPANRMIYTVRMTHIPTGFVVEGTGRSPYRIEQRLLKELSERVNDDFS